MDAILVDSAAFIAVVDESDAHHERATTIYRELSAQRCPLYTTNLIVAETCTFLLYHSGHHTALGFGTFIDKAGAPHRHLQSTVPDRQLRIVYSTPELERAAWDIFAAYETAGLSFTDCVSFAAMHTLGIRKAFTFDKHYDIMGFERL